MIQRLFAPAAVLGGLLVLAGCCSTPRREVAYVPPPPAPCDRCNAGPAVAPRYVQAPLTAPIAVPAQAPVYTQPVVPPVAAPAPAGPAAAAAVPDGSIVQGRFNPPQVADARSPSQEAVVRLAPPELSVPSTPPSAVPQQTKEPPVAPQPPVATERKDAAPAGPIDIPQFAVARTNVANGLQPFPDGVAWLRDHGYRTVLYVRAPGTDDSAARRQFEKFGLRYLSIETDARTLNKQTVDNFNRLVTDEANLPLFVYDKDASITGGLWYLHFRLIEGASDEKARAEAARLGFRQEQDDNHRTTWIAVQKLLEANGR